MDSVKIARPGFVVGATLYSAYLAVILLATALWLGTSYAGYSNIGGWEKRPVETGALVTGLALLGLLHARAAYGLWNARPWAWWLTIIGQAFTAIWALSMGRGMGSPFHVLGAAIVSIWLLLPDGRRYLGRP